MNVKQVIVMRKDLNMRKGKMIAQGAHASMKVFLDRGMMQYPLDGDQTFAFTVTPAMAGWLEGAFAKVCVYVESEEHLLRLYAQAEAAKIPCALIQDSGRTEFHGVPTYTCCAIGPAPCAEIDAITGSLPLL